MAGLPPQLLVGHAAQLEFWTDEVAHCLHVLDTFEQRFQAKLNAQQQYVVDLDPLFHRPIGRPGYVAEPHRYHVRGELCRAFVSFLQACHRHQLAASQYLTELCDRLGIAAPDFAS